MLHNTGIFFITASEFKPLGNPERARSLRTFPFMKSLCLVLSLTLLAPIFPDSALAHPTVLVQNGFSIIMYQVGNKTGIQVEQDGVMRFELEKEGEKISFRVRDASGKITLQGNRFDAIPASILSSYPGLKENLDQSFKPVDQSDLGNPNSRASKLKILKQHNPAGYAVIDRLKSKASFDFFSGIEAGESVVDALDTGVHESLHILDSEITRRDVAGTYFLIDQRVVDAPRIKTFHRNQVLKLMTAEEKKGHYVEAYLEGDSGAQGLEVLLDELNAYAHGAWTTIELSEGLNERNTINPGLVAMMDYTAKYLRIAATEQKTLYQQMRSGKYATTVDALWTQAEAVLNRACASKLGYLDSSWKNRLKSLYSTLEKGTVEAFVGHPIEVPANCL
jgi:hypothetical protein